MKRTKRWMTGICTITLLSAATVARAHSDLEIGKDVADPASGNLTVEYEFDSRVIGVDYTGFGSLFQAEDPGFVPAPDEAPLIYEIDHGTEIEFEVTHADPGVSIQVGVTTLDESGEGAVVGVHTGVCSVDLTTTCSSDAFCAGLLLGTCITDDPEASGLHQHPPFRLNLAPIASDQFGEGRLSFRLKEGAGSSVGYGQSQVYTVTLSNGYLPGLAYGAGPAVDAARLACQKAVGAQGRAFMNKVHTGLRQCLDKVAAYDAKNAAGHPSAGAALVAAEKACADASGATLDSKTLLGKLQGARTSAISAIQKKCGTPAAVTIDGKTIPAAASNDLALQQIQTHLGMVQCRAEELLGAAYFNATEALEQFSARPSQGGAALSTYFRCLKARQGGE